MHALGPGVDREADSWVTEQRWSRAHPAFQRLVTGFAGAVLAWSSGVGLGYWAAQPLHVAQGFPPGAPWSPEDWRFVQILQQNLAVVAVAASGAVMHRLFTLVALGSSGLVLGWCWGGTGLTTAELLELSAAYALWEWIGLWLGGAVGLQAARLPSRWVWSLLVLAGVATALGAWTESSFLIIRRGFRSG